MKKVVAGAAFIVMIMLAGCAQPPLKDIADAKAALESAKIAGAQTYAPQEYSSAKGYIDKAESYVGTRQYKEAKVDALTGKQLADTARQIALGRNTASAGTGSAVGGESPSSSVGAVGIQESSIVGKGSLGQGILIKQLKMIHFDFDDYALSNEAQQILMQNAQWLTANPAVDIQIEGHCDERGSAEYNLALGEKRAIAARDYLIQLGVKKERMSVISYGKERPLNPAHNEQAWAENRRDEFVVITR